jgi:hypothetical protein
MVESPKAERIYREQIEGVTNALPVRLRDVFAAVIAATVTALVLGSEALLNWVNNLPIGGVSDFLLLLTQDWQDLMTSIGVTAYADGFKTFLANLQLLHW